MFSPSLVRRRGGPSAHPPAARRGAFTVVACACLVAAIGFAALSVDVGMIAYTRTRLQNAADAAALAAAQEITKVVEQTGAAGGNAGSVASAAESAARQMASKVAGLNGVYVDPARDVQFGRRTYDKAASKFKVTWGGTPFNAVKVTARMDNSDPKAKDASLKLFFASYFGRSAQAMRASGSAYVDSRDLVLVLDYTASMNDDSTFAGISTLGRSAVESNMLAIYGQLGLTLPKMPNTPSHLSLTVNGTNGAPNVTAVFKGATVDVTSNINMSSVKLTLQSNNPSSTATTTRTISVSGKTGSYAGTGTSANWIVTQVEVTASGKTTTVAATTANIKTAYGLTGSYPYPGGSWDEYVAYVQTLSKYKSAYGYDSLGGYDWKYGRLTFVQYLLEYRFLYSDTPVLWKTSHYPFCAMKDGASLFCEFLEDLDFGDNLGLVTYDESSRVETTLYEPLDGANVNISATPMTTNYAAIDTIQRHKQAGHYASYTGIGYGIDKAISLIQSHGRYGARPTILLMTDGNANVAPSGWQAPAGWNWNKVTDFDGDGTADYTTADVNKLYAFYQAKRAIDLGYTMHTMNVGADVDGPFMAAIAKASGGQYISVPGGTNVATMESQLRDAFSKIAANVPPAKLLIENETP